ncbi:MAG: type II toxin-antitoxin system HicB family antitoxin, partial [Proteobacteria bacterium]|nr:type II toxin-antitoxin system HicB family antitoxin [Pseudomonadota bacterium]
MKYKGYEAVVKYSDEDETFVGEVINSHDILVFDGNTVDEVNESFHAVVDEYLEDCETEGRTPQKPFSGQFITRISPSLHPQLFIQAKTSGKIGATELYFAHFLGANGASEFINAKAVNGETKASYLFPAAAKANKNVFFN